MTQGNKDSVNTQTAVPEQIQHYLTTGCDERIYRDQDGLNRYGIDPFDYPHYIHRGSCTCGTLNDESVKMMEELLQKDLTQTANYERLLQLQTDELKEVLNFEGEDKFEIFYAPSGSDLVYFPIIFCKILFPERPILNLLSCPEELGSGTLLAVKGEYHAEYNQFEERVPKGQKVHPDFEIEVLSLTARGVSGKIIDHQAYIKEQVRLHPNHSIVVSLVYGSKSGIEDKLDIMDHINREDIIWTIDMCQFRHSKKLIHRLLEKNGCVMITGSKFYQAPPFCGAMLVSRSFMEKLKKGRLEEFSKLKTLFSGYDFPESIRSEVQVPLRQNIGLRLRWACSLHEKQLFKQTNKVLVHQKIDAWNDFVIKKLNSHEDFELIPDQRMTNKTIISFRVKKGDRFLNHLELKELYRIIVTEGRIGGADPKKVFIGQPVAYVNKSFLRLAIGSMNIRAFIEKDETRFEEDAMIIDLIRSKIACLDTNK